MRRLIHRLTHVAGLARGRIVPYDEWPGGRRMLAFMCGKCGRHMHRWPVNLARTLD